MSAKTHRIRLSKLLLNAHVKFLSGVVLVVMTLQIQQANAQELVLQDTTIATTATFSANSITAGPNFTIASTGDVIFRANTFAIVPRFFIVKGGKLSIVSGGSIVSVETERLIIPDEYRVHQNFPNPFNTETEIRFELAKDNHVMIRVYNTHGQQIITLVDAQYGPGVHSVHWDGNDSSGSPVSNGVYLYQIIAGQFSQARKMSLTR
jgi:hypothetical protein